MPESKLADAIEEEKGTVPPPEGTDSEVDDDSPSPPAPSPSSSPPPSSPSSVVYVGHLPPRSDESELGRLLFQFGKVRDLRLSRNPKNGRSRRYAFVRFQNPDVARAAARAMSGHVLGGRALVCHVVREEDVHPRMYGGPGSVKPGRKGWIRRHKELLKKRRDRAEADDDKKKGGGSENDGRRARKMAEKDRRRREKLEAMGIEYDFPGYPRA